MLQTLGHTEDHPPTSPSRGSTKHTRAGRSFRIGLIKDQTPNTWRGGTPLGAPTLPGKRFSDVQEPKRGLSSRNPSTTGDWGRDPHLIFQGEVLVKAYFWGWAKLQGGYTHPPNPIFQSNLIVSFEVVCTCKFQACSTCMFSRRNDSRASRLFYSALDFTNYMSYLRKQPTNQTKQKGRFSWIVVNYLSSYMILLQLDPKPTAVLPLISLGLGSELKTGIFRGVRCTGQYLERLPASLSAAVFGCSTWDEVAWHSESRKSRSLKTRPFQGFPAGDPQTGHLKSLLLWTTFGPISQRTRVSNSL